jgi:hypothetical protein
MTEDRSRCEGCFRTIDEIPRLGAADSASAGHLVRCSVGAAWVAADSLCLLTQPLAARSPAMKHITFYLDFVSPYAWLAFERLPEALEG